MEKQETTVKRGRKPKKTLQVLKKFIEKESPIIVHLPIDYSDIVDEQNNDIFIKSEPFDTNSKDYSINEKENRILKTKIEELNEKLKKYEKVNKPCVIPIYNNTSKCWWCRYSYNNTSVELPEHYFNNMFYGIGNFCSYNCAMAYNIDINDENVSKRNSLLHLLYKQTYKEDIVIKPASSWKILKDNGGSINIEEFHENFISNKTNYLYIRPPFVSRISYVEKIPINETIEVIKTNDFLLKRSKPLNSSKYSLESTIGLKKIVNKNNFDS